MARRRSEEERARRLAAIRQVRQYPDPVLRQAGRPVVEFGDGTASLAERMFSLMDDAQGVGLAAPQIGILQRLFVYELEGEKVVCANPEITDRSDEVEVGSEGCLSLDVLLQADSDLPVERHVAVSLRAVDEHGRPFERRAEGLEARVIQHELDHLDGRLILDRTDAEHRRAALRLLRDADFR